MTIHFPWDNGAVTGIFADLLKQQTVKTKCGKRVKFPAQSTFSELDVTCSDCLHTLADEENAYRELRKRYPDLMPERQF